MNIYIAFAHKVGDSQLSDKKKTAVKLCYNRSLSNNDRIRAFDCLICSPRQVERSPQIRQPKTCIRWLLARERFYNFYHVSSWLRPVSFLRGDIGNKSWRNLFRWQKRDQTLHTLIQQDIQTNIYSRMAYDFSMKVSRTQHLRASHTIHYTEIFKQIWVVYCSTTWNLLLC